MNESAGSRDSFIIGRMLLWQLVTGLVLAAALWGIFDRITGWSALLGGMTAVIPNAFLAARIAFSRREEGARSLLRAAWIGETGKLALTVLMFTLVFTLVRPLSAAALFAGFIVTQSVAFAGLLVRRGQKQKTGTTNGS